MMPEQCVVSHLGWIPPPPPHTHTSRNDAGSKPCNAGQCLNNVGPLFFECVHGWDSQGYKSLLASLPRAALDRANEQFISTIKRWLSRYSGYISEEDFEVEGEVLVAFYNSLEAVLFAQEVQASLMSAAWPAALLTHPATLGEGFGVPPFLALTQG